MMNPSTISEFTITTYGSNGSFDYAIWRWMPHDGRSQPLAAGGFLPADVAAAFDDAVNRASIWLLGDEVYFDEVDGGTSATVEQKAQILDGFLWIGGGGTLYPAADPDSPDYWARQTVPMPDGVKVVSHDAWLKIQEAPIVPASSPEFDAVISQAQSDYDHRAKRYRKLGWDDADMEAEFGKRPVNPISAPKKKEAR